MDAIRQTEVRRRLNACPTRLFGRLQSAASLSSPPGFQPGSGKVSGTHLDGDVGRVQIVAFVPRGDHRLVFQRLLARFLVVFGDRPLDHFRSRLDVNFPTFLFRVPLVVGTVSAHHLKTDSNQMVAQSGYAVNRVRPKSRWPAICFNYGVVEWDYFMLFGNGT